MKRILPKTTEIYRKINEVEDTRKLHTERDQLLKGIEKSEEQLIRVDSMEEFHAISQDIKDLQTEITELEIKRRIQPKVADAVTKKEGEKVKDTYNQEFQPHYNEYLKLKKEFKKQMITFAKNIEPIVDNMIKIENLEESFHMLKIKRHVAPQKEFLTLPIETKGLKDPYSFVNGIKHNSTDYTKEVVRAIKKNWGER